MFADTFDLSVFLLILLLHSDSKYKRVSIWNELVEAPTYMGLCVICTLVPLPYKKNKFLVS